MGNIRNTRLPRPTTAQLGFEARRRIARQIAETTGVIVTFGSAVAAPQVEARG